MRRTTLILSVLAVLAAGIVFWVIFSPDDKLQTHPGDSGVAASPVTEDAETELADTDNDSESSLAGDEETESGDRTELATLEGDPATAAAAPTGSLLLRVVDPEGGPIEALNVSVESGHGARHMPWMNMGRGTEAEALAEMPSNGNGEVELLGIPTGVELSLVIRGDYWVERRISLASLRAHETRDLGQLPIARGVLLTGRVLGEDGKAIEGAQVRLAESTGSSMPDGILFAGMGGGLERRTETDADGRFRLQGLPPKQYTISATRVGQVRAETGLVLSLSNPDHRVELRMSDGGWITGVVRAEDGTPLPSAKVALIPARGFASYQWDTDRILEEGVEVGEDGSFRLTGVPEDNSHRVVAASEGYARGRSDRVVPGMKVELGLAPRVSLAGVVLDAAGVPVADAVVTASRSDATTSRNMNEMRQESASTDDAGKFEFTELAAGTYTVAVTSPAGELNQEGVEVSDESPELELQLPAGDSVIVRVADADGQAITDAFVEIQQSNDANTLELLSPGARRVSVAVGEDGEIIHMGGGMTRSGRTDAAGMIRFVGLQEGTYQLTVDKQGFARTTQNVERTGDDEQLVVVELPHASSLRVLAVDVSGNPIEGANLELERVDAEPKDSQSRATDAWGLAEFTALTPGDYTLREIASGASRGMIVFDHESAEGESEPQEEVLRFALEAGEAGEQQIVLSAKAVPTVLVTRLGVPVPNAGVSIESQSAGQMHYIGLPGMGGSDSTTNAQGLATLPPNDPGSYVIKARASATNPYTELEVTLGPGAQQFTVELATGGVSGTVTGPGGPLVDAQVSLSRQRGEGDNTSSRAVGVISLALGDDDEDDVMTFDFNGADARAKTDGDGRFNFLDVPPGTYTMSVKAKGHSPFSTEPFEVTEGTQVDRGVITLEAGASLQGRIINIPTDSDGNTPFYTLVRLQDADGNTVRYGSARASGKYRFDELEPGTYRISVDVPNGEARTSDLINIVAGSPTEFDFPL